MLRRLRQTIGMVTNLRPDGRGAFQLLETIVSSQDFNDWSEKAAPVMEERDNAEPTASLLTYTVASGDEYNAAVFEAPVELPIAAPVASVADLPVPYHVETNPGEQLRLVTSETRYYKSTAQPNTSTGDVQCIWAPSGSQKIPVATSTDPSVALQQEAQGIAATSMTSYAENARYPGVLMNALYPSYLQDLTEKNEDLRLGFYRGRQPYHIDGTWPFPAADFPQMPVPTYPLVTPFNRRADGTQLGEYSLELQGPAGTYEKLLRKWLTLRSTAAPIKRTFYLTATDLAGLDMTRKIRVDGVDYLLQSVKVTVPITRGASCVLVPVFRA